MRNNMRKKEDWMYKTVPVILADGRKGYLMSFHESLLQDGVYVHSCTVKPQGIAHSWPTNPHEISYDIHRDLPF